MKTILSLMLACAAVSYSVGQQTQTRSVSSFSGIKVSEGIDAYLTKGDKESVRVEVTGADLDDVLTEVSGSYLKVHMADGNHRKTSVKVHITYVKIDKLSASSAGNIFSEGSISADIMEMSASSAGTIEIPLQANKLEAKASSAGEIDLKGKVKSAVFDVSSAGEIDAYDLESESVEVEASSAGSIKVNVTKNLTAHASSGGGIRYRGNPDKSITESSSGGSVKKSD